MTLLTSACSSDDGAEGEPDGGSSAAAATSSTTASPAPDGGGDLAPQPSAEAAVTRMLELLQAGDVAGSYGLLDEAGRRSFATVEAWERRRAGAAPIVSFEIGEVSGGEVVATIVRDPVLDPFQGLVPARERQTWTAFEVAEGWLVGAQPEVEYLLPPDVEAAAAAVEWARDVQACDEAGATSRQAVEILFNASTTLPAVCGATGTVAAGAVGNLDAGPVSADIVAQYSSDALTWARVVPITIGDLRLSIIMAPIGDSWEVLGVSD